MRSDDDKESAGMRKRLLGTMYAEMIGFVSWYVSKARILSICDWMI